MEKSLTFFFLLEVVDLKISLDHKDVSPKLIQMH